MPSSSAERLVLPCSPFTTGQARAAGISDQQLTRLVTQRVLRRPLRQVYVSAELSDTVHLRAQAAALVISPHAVLTDRSAAWLWGVDVMRPFEMDVPPPLEVFVLRGHSRVRRREAAGGRRDLKPADITEVAGVRVTTPLRTSLDLGCRLNGYAAMAAMDSFARIHDVGRAQLAAELPRYRRRRGVVQLRALVPLVDPMVESPGESFTKLAIYEAGLPMPRSQHWVQGPHGESFRLDFAYPHSKVCVEYDGEQFHTSQHDVTSDMRRREWLRRDGWIVIVVDKRSFTREAQDAWTSELRASLARRAAR